MANADAISWCVRFALVLACGCGRLGFDGTAIDAGPGSDMLDDGPSEPGVLIDFTGAVPYDPADFGDGSPVGNEARAITAIGAPFADGFAVGAGRSLIEIRMNMVVVVHDLTPTASNANGPDEISWLSFGGGTIWITSASPTSGDGLFLVDQAWNVTREVNENNFAGSAWDEAGEFDDIGTSRFYYSKGDETSPTGNTVFRRDAPGARTMIYKSSGPNLYSLALTATAAYSVEGEDVPTTLVRIAEGSHAAATIGTASTLELADGRTAAGVVVVRDEREIVQYADDDTTTVLATSPDADSRWVAATIPRSPHPLAGRIVVLEVNRALNRDRLLLLP